jgi:hypothetical protein
LKTKIKSTKEKIDRDKSKKDL